jgi:hypothetical protein
LGLYNFNHAYLGNMFKLVAGDEYTNTIDLSVGHAETAAQASGLDPVGID